MLASSVPVDASPGVANGDTASPGAAAEPPSTAGVYWLEVVEKLAAFIATGRRAVESPPEDAGQFPLVRGAGGTLWTVGIGSALRRTQRPLQVDPATGRTRSTVVLRTSLPACRELRAGAQQLAAVGRHVFVLDLGPPRPRRCCNGSIYEGRKLSVSGVESRVGAGTSRQVHATRLRLPGRPADHTHADLRVSGLVWSGCPDLNRGPLRPERSALTKLRHSPSSGASPDDAILTGAPGGGRGRRWPGRPVAGRPAVGSGAGGGSGLTVGAWGRR
jgi:hypothetical protein